MLNFFRACSIISTLLLSGQKRKHRSSWHANFIEPPNDFMTESLAHDKFKIGNIKNAQMAELQMKQKANTERGVDVRQSKILRGIVHQARGHSQQLSSFHRSMGDIRQYHRPTSISNVGRFLQANQSHGWRLSINCRGD